MGHFTASVVEKPRSVCLRSWLHPGYVLASQFCFLHELTVLFPPSRLYASSQCLALKESFAGNWQTLKRVQGCLLSHALPEAGQPWEDFHCEWSLGKLAFDFCLSCFCRRWSPCSFGPKPSQFAGPIEREFPSHRPCVPLGKLKDWWANHRIAGA